MHVLGQVRILKKAYPGIMHALIFWGVTIQVIGTAINLMQMALFTPFALENFPRQGWYLAYELIMDLAGVAILLGVTLAAFRRLVLRPKTLETRWDDLYALAMLFLIATVGFTNEATRLITAQPEWATWSPATATSYARPARVSSFRSAMGWAAAKRPPGLRAWPSRASPSWRLSRVPAPRNIHSDRTLDVPQQPAGDAGGGAHDHHHDAVMSQVLGDLGAAGAARPGRDRRGAGRLVQAGRGAALQRPRPRPRARAAAPRSGAAGVGDAVSRLAVAGAAGTARDPCRVAGRCRPGEVSDAPRSVLPVARGRRYAFCSGVAGPSAGADASGAASTGSGGSTTYDPGGTDANW